MTAPRGLRNGRAARLRRLFDLAAVAAVFGFLLWIVLGGAAPAHDPMTGNIDLAAALETVAAEGDARHDAARRALQRHDRQR